MWLLKSVNAWTCPYLLIIQSGLGWLGSIGLTYHMHFKEVEWNYSIHPSVCPFVGLWAKWLPRDISSFVDGSISNYIHACDLQREVPFYINLKSLWQIFSTNFMNWFVNSVTFIFHLGPSFYQRYLYLHCSSNEIALFCEILKFEVLS